MGETEKSNQLTRDASEGEKDTGGFQSKWHSKQGSLSSCAISIQRTIMDTDYKHYDLGWGTGARSAFTFILGTQCSIGEGTSKFI